MNALMSNSRLAVFSIFLFACGVATAAPKTWTLNNVTTSDGASWTGTFDYDAATNTYSSINIVTDLSGAPNPWNTVSTDAAHGVGCPDPATASGVTVGPNPDGILIFCMDFAAALTNSGGTVNLLTGDYGWLTIGIGSPISSGSVSAPPTWTLNNVTTSDGASWTGTFDYDAATNTYSSINIVTDLSGAPNPWNTVSTDAAHGVGCPDPATASGVTVGPNPDGILIFCMDFAAALTNSGGTVNLLTGDYGWLTIGIGSPISSGSVTSAGLPTLSAVVDIESTFLHLRHDGRDPNPSTPGGMNPNDPIPVVVFGSSTLVGDPEDLDTDLIDPGTLAFGPGMGGISPSHPPEFNLDEDSDGIDDARFQFLMSDAAFDSVTCTDSSGTLTGELMTGEFFAGSDTFIADCNVGCH